jgi:tetratricopeptide (TPR) repeat protein
MRLFSALRPLLLFGIALAVLRSAPAHAQEPPSATAPNPEIDRLRAVYEYGRYSDVLERAQERIDRGGLPREALVELHKLAGLSAFNLGNGQAAERHFGALLRLDPDYALDPFAVSPPAIAAFEQMRKDLAPQLELIRQQLRLDQERLRREAEERELARRVEEERRRRLEEVSRRLTVQTVHKRSFLVNFVPFGAGQFQQDRPVAGAVLASLQGALALTSIIAYLAYDGILQERSVVVDTVSGPVTFTRKGIPPEREKEANAWRLVKYASAGAFYTLYGYGVVDALYHHKSETITESTIQPPSEPVQPASPPPDVPRTPAPERLHDSEPKPPPPRAFLFPMSGGVGAGLTLQF